MILANDFSSGLIRFQKLLAQMANRVLLDLARAGSSSFSVGVGITNIKTFHFVHPWKQYEDNFRN